MPRTTSPCEGAVAPVGRASFSDMGTFHLTPAMQADEGVMKALVAAFEAHIDYSNNFCTSVEVDRAERRLAEERARVAGGKKVSAVNDRLLAARGCMWGVAISLCMWAFITAVAVQILN